jgi:[ribosomal protein S18]-alanine N-acetyltransferase
MTARSTAARKPAYYQPVLREATLADLRAVATWVSSARECELWAGWRVRYPVEADALAATIDFAHHGGFALVHADEVLGSDQEVIGFGQIVSKARGRAHLARLIVEPQHRGRGIGERLVRLLLIEARASGHKVASLNVDPANAVAIALYVKIGFADAPRPGDEPDPHGSRFMTLTL